MAEPVQGPSMNEPKKGHGHSAVNPPSAQTPIDQSQYTPMDPSGIWAKFLSMNGSQPVTKEQVQMFIEALNKSIGLLIQHNTARMKEAMEKMKRVQEGEEE